MPSRASIIRLVKCVLFALGAAVSPIGADGQAEAFGNPRVAVEPLTSPVIEAVGELDGIEMAHHRIGGIQRMFVIDNAWDLRRFQLLIPSLPDFDPSEHMLIVIVSWPNQPKSVTGVCIDRDSLTLQIEHPPPPEGPSQEYRPPKFSVFRTMAWDGHVRFVVNGALHHTVWKREQLACESAALWQEVERLCRGGAPTRDQLLQYLRDEHYRYSDISDDALLAKTDQHGIDRKHFYSWLFRDLGDMRATPVLPQLFALCEQAEKHDPAAPAAFQAIVAIGGEPVFNVTTDWIESSDVRRRRIAIGLLHTFGLPESRVIARVALFDSDSRVAYTAIELLCRLGLTEADVPFLVLFINDEENLESGNESPSRFGIACSIIFQLGQLGDKARQALSSLETLSRHESSHLREAAVAALEKIQPDRERPSNR